MPTVNRRTLLAALAVSGAAAACTADADRQRGWHGPPDPQLVDLADERDMLAAYDATMAQHAELRDRLRPLRDHHADHVAALERVVGQPAGGTPTAAGATPTPRGGQTAAVPAAPREALAALRARERAAAAARTRSCVTARPDRAPLLGSIAACEASHEVLLS